MKIVVVVFLIFCLVSLCAGNRCTDKYSGYSACSQSSINGCQFYVSVVDYCCPNERNDCYCADNGNPSCRMTPSLKGGSIFMVIAGTLGLLACFPCALIFALLIAVTTPLFFIAWPIVLLVCFPVTLALALLIAGGTLLNQYNNSVFANGA